MQSAASVLAFFALHWIVSLFSLRTGCRMPKGVSVILKPQRNGNARGIKKAPANAGEMVKTVVLLDHTGYGITL